MTRGFLCRGAGSAGRFEGDVHVIVVGRVEALDHGGAVIDGLQLQVDALFGNGADGPRVSQFFLGECVILAVIVKLDEDMVVLAAIIQRERHHVGREGPRDVRVVGSVAEVVTGCDGDRRGACKGLALCCISIYHPGNQ